MGKASDKEIEIEVLEQIIRAADARKAADIGGYKVKTGIALIDDIPTHGDEHRLIELIKDRLSGLPSDPSEKDFGKYQDVRDKCEEHIRNMRTLASTKEGRALLDRKLDELIEAVKAD